ncbi:hypothetical protein PAL_GLEAN10007583 [Pteropus alecto]|uniref:Uncharacterized protein n=1 Tax=Pteropus alecto TaxID=9402 RepID=L5K3Y7_PTEAL|nr:hypothetical protein PAL_GLEAN10007583 [Pteropus alecto]
MVLPGDNSYSAPHQSDNEAASEKRPEILNWQNRQGLDLGSQILKVQMQPELDLALKTSLIRLSKMDSNKPECPPGYLGNHMSCWKVA